MVIDAFGMKERMKKENEQLQKDKLEFLHTITQQQARNIEKD